MVTCSLDALKKYSKKKETQIEKEIVKTKLMIIKSKRSE